MRKCRGQDKLAVAEPEMPNLERTKEKSAI